LLLLFSGCLGEALFGGQVVAVTLWRDYILFMEIFKKTPVSCTLIIEAHSAFLDAPNTIKDCCKARANPLKFLE